MKKAFWAIAILFLVLGVLSSCSSNEKNIEIAKNSGILSAFAKEDSRGLYDVDWNVEVVQDSGLHSSSIRYLITFNYTSSVNYELSMVEVAGIKPTDEDAFKHGTVAFIVKDKSSPKVYRTEKGETVRGEQEIATVFIYDVETDTFFAQKRFNGDRLDKTYKNYRGGDIFINEVDYAEIKNFLDELGDK